MISYVTKPFKVLIFGLYQVRGEERKREGVREEEEEGEKGRAVCILFYIHSLI